MSTSLRLTLAALAVSPLFAQTAYQAPNLKTELFGGFSTTRMEPGRAGGKGRGRVRLDGGAVGVTSYQFFRRWGVAAEFNGHSRAEDGLDVSSQTYLFGGTYRGFERPRFALTGRIFAGVNRWESSVVPAGGYRTQDSFIFGFGQSVDIKIPRSLRYARSPTWPSSVGRSRTETVS